MKLKLSVRVRPGKITAGTTLTDDEPRADMFWPAWSFALGLFLVMFGLIGGTVTILVRIPFFLIALMFCCLLMGVAVLMCWKNQTIRMLPNDSFEYRTFLGNKTVYRFSDITGVKKGSDSTTIFVGNGKVHIESCAIISDRLSDRIDRQLKAIYEDGLDRTQKP